MAAAMPRKIHDMMITAKTMGTDPDPGIYAIRQHFLYLFMMSHRAILVGGVWVLVPRPLNYIDTSKCNPQHPQPKWLPIENNANGGNACEVIFLIFVCSNEL